MVGAGMSNLRNAATTHKRTHISPTMRQQSIKRARLDSKVNSPALAGGVLDVLLGQLIQLPRVPRGHEQPVHELARGLPERPLRGARIRRVVALAAAAGRCKGRKLGRP